MAVSNDWPWVSFLMSGGATSVVKLKDGKLKAAMVCRQGSIFCWLPISVVPCGYR